MKKKELVAYILALGCSSGLCTSVALAEEEGLKKLKELARATEKLAPYDRQRLVTRLNLVCYYWYGKQFAQAKQEEASLEKVLSQAESTPGLSSTALRDIAFILRNLADLYAPAKKTPTSNPPKSSTKHEDFARAETYMQRNLAVIEQIVGTDPKREAGYKDIIEWYNARGKTGAAARISERLTQLMDKNASDIKRWDQCMACGRG